MTTPSPEREPGTLDLSKLPSAEAIGLANHGEFDRPFEDCLREAYAHDARAIVEAVLLSQADHNGNLSVGGLRGRYFEYVSVPVQNLLAQLFPKVSPPEGS